MAYSSSSRHDILAQLGLRRGTPEITATPRVDFSSASCKRSKQKASGTGIQVPRSPSTQQYHGPVADSEPLAAYLSQMTCPYIGRVIRSRPKRSATTGLRSANLLPLRAAGCSSPFQDVPHRSTHGHVLIRRRYLPRPTTRPSSRPWVPVWNGLRPPLFAMRGSGARGN